MQPWFEISQCTNWIQEQTFLLPPLLSLVIDYTFELDVFTNFHNLFKRKCYKSRPNYPFPTHAKFTSLGFVYHKKDRQRCGEMEILMGDLCGYFYTCYDNTNNTEKWTLSKKDRCVLLDEIISQSNIPKSLREAASLDAKQTLLQRIIPGLCAHVASLRLEMFKDQFHK